MFYSLLLLLVVQLSLYKLYLVKFICELFLKPFFLMTPGPMKRDFYSIDYFFQIIEEDAELMEGIDSLMMTSPLSSPSPSSTSSPVASPLYERVELQTVEEKLEFPAIEGLPMEIPDKFTADDQIRYIFG